MNKYGSQDGSFTLARGEFGIPQDETGKPDTYVDPNYLGSQSMILGGLYSAWEAAHEKDEFFDPVAFAKRFGLETSLIPENPYDRRPEPDLEIEKAETEAKNRKLAEKFNIPYIK